MKPLEWQTNCLQTWARNGYRGIVKAVTGSGKTYLALSAVRRLESVSDRDLRVVIVVPRTFLASQWREEIKKHLDVRTWDIGIFSGIRKDFGRKFMIYVVNSARYSLSRYILSELLNGRAVFLIADECHHYGSAENMHIFDFYPAMDKDAPYYALGLSATPEIANFKSIAIPLGREIYSYGLGDALRDNVISRFILFSVRLGFTPDEAATYTEMSESLSIYLHKLRNLRPELHGLPPAQFFARLHKLARQDGGQDSAALARAALTLIFNRRTVSHMATSRHHCAVSIVKALPADFRVILFCERIQAAEQLYRALRDVYPGQTGLYHSQMADLARQEMLERYKIGALRLLVCCKALDEGLNVPSTDAGVIVSSSMSARQRVQRLGRLLRRSKEIKRVYYLYMGDSHEDRELVVGLEALCDDVPMVSLSYRGEMFRNSEYEKLRERVLTEAAARGAGRETLNALYHNMERVLPRGDFLLPEQACREKLRACLPTKERNYWTSVLYAILARVGNL